MSQSDFLALPTTYSRHSREDQRTTLKTRVESRAQGAIGLGFHWLENWREIFSQTPVAFATAWLLSTVI